MFTGRCSSPRPCTTVSGWRLSLVLAGAVLLSLLAAPAEAATITVTTDSGGLVNNDGFCSLREAVRNANNNAQTFPECLAGEGGGIVDRIEFAIPGMGVPVIGLTGPVPSITDPVVIDGLTQLGVGVSCPLASVPNGPLGVQIDDLFGLTAFTLSGGSDGSTIRGLSITDFDLGIHIGSNNNTVTCNYLGVAADGVTADLNVVAVRVGSGTDNIIGGPGRRRPQRNRP